MRVVCENNQGQMEYRRTPVVVRNPKGTTKQGWYVRAIFFTIPAAPRETRVVGMCVATP